MFTPIETSIGAILLHLATTRLLFDGGAILGASSLIRTVLQHPKTATTSHFFVGGAGLAVLLTQLVLPGFVPRYPGFGLNKWGDVWRTVGSGALTGWGTKNCGGCTSGHMLCGIGRLNLRSILATAIFFSTAMLTFQLTNPSLETVVCEASDKCYLPQFPNKMTALLLYSVLVAAATKAKIPKDFLSRENAFKATYLTSGLLFGLGLFISGMADPPKVQAVFAIRLKDFDISKWDPSMMMVMLFGILPNIISSLRGDFDQPPTFAEKWSLPTKTMKDVDVRFVLGAVAFGLAWGVTGVCPGPGLLRTFVQPAWGVLWMAGFWAGSLDVL